MSTEENNKEQTAGEAIMQDLTDQYANKSDEKESPRYSSDDLRNFKVYIQNKIEKTTEDLKYLKVVLGDRQKGIKVEGYEDTSPSEIERQIIFTDDLISELNKALARIKNKTFGLCQASKELIPKEQLLANPTILIKNDHTAFFTDERKCRVCGCTNDDCSQCIEKTGVPCYWVERDLCSACVEEDTADQQTLTEPVADLIKPPAELIQPAPLLTKPLIDSGNETQQQTTSSNNNDMNFFQQLAQASAQQTDLTIRILQKDNRLTLNILPGSKSTTLKPILVTGTAQELDECFFKTIAPGLSDIKGLVTNIEEVKKDLAAQKDKPSPAPASPAKKEEKKPDKKQVKKAPAKKDKPGMVVKEPTKPAEPTLL